MIQVSQMHLALCYFFCCLSLRGVHGIGSVKPVKCPEIIAKGCDSTILLGLMEDNKYSMIQSVEMLSKMLVPEISCIALEANNSERQPYMICIKAKTYKTFMQ